MESLERLIGVRSEWACLLTKAHTDGRLIRIASTRATIPCITTVAGARAMVESMQRGHGGIVEVRSLQEYHA